MSGRIVYVQTLPSESVFHSVASPSVTEPSLASLATRFSYMYRKVFVGTR